ncbi:MAG: hypothetical protein NVS3B20_13950 [Polyangiales bacterium]
MSLNLHGDEFWISPYVFSCFVALREKGLPFEYREVSLGAGAQLQPRFRDASVTARVPALEHDDFWLAESSAIVEYVEESFPGPKLLPKDSRDRARARQLMSWLRSDLMPLREQRPTHTMFYQHAKTPRVPRQGQFDGSNWNAAAHRRDTNSHKEAPGASSFPSENSPPPQIRSANLSSAPQSVTHQIEAAGALAGALKNAAEKLIRVADQCVRAETVSLFSTWSIADADLGFALHRLILNGDEVPEKLRRYAQAQWERPSVKEFVDHPRKPYVPYS